jgi:acyl-CoA synthetase (AMP-forming)/AMP-acid ligase II
MLARIVQEMDSDPGLGVPSLRSISYGGARMAAPVLERALELFPEVSFVNAYGLTETSSTIALLGPDDHRQALASDDPGVRRRLESVGRPLPGVEVSVLDDAGAEVPAGTTGAICVRGPQVGGTYLDTDSILDGGGWLTTGDVGHLDPDGFLFVEGRADDVIIKGGENLSPAEIEDTLLRHPAVLAAAVVAVPDPEWGESVGAAVVATGPAADLHDELVAWVRRHLGSLKTPSRLEFFEDLPTTATGKILRREVRHRLTPRDP